MGSDGGWWMSGLHVKHQISAGYRHESLLMAVVHDPAHRPDRLIVDRRIRVNPEHQGKMSSADATLMRR
jgi:hypothetical protein